jgi:aminoglycoside 3-N-acetyltransferase I
MAMQGLQGDGFVYDTAGMDPVATMTVRRLDVRDVAMAKGLFVMMAQVFGEPAEELSDAHVKELLADGQFWAVAAFLGDEVIGGVTAHVLPMTQRRASVLFVYDIAVRSDRQRRGVGRELIRMLRTEAAGRGLGELFVLADNEDAHALDFYRALGAVPSAVTMFEFSADK